MIIAYNYYYWLYDWWGEAVTGRRSVGRFDCCTAVFEEEEEEVDETEDEEAENL